MPSSAIRHVSTAPRVVFFDRIYICFREDCFYGLVNTIVVDMLLTHYERIFHRRLVDPHALDSSDEERLALKLDERLGVAHPALRNRLPSPAIGMMICRFLIVLILRTY